MENASGFSRYLEGEDREEFFEYDKKALSDFGLMDIGEDYWFARRTIITTPTSLEFGLESDKGGYRKDAFVQDFGDGSYNLYTSGEDVVKGVRAVLLINPEAFLKRGVTGSLPILIFYD